MLEITDWNINPNQDWFVKLSDNGDDILVELFNTLVDAIAGINLVASGSGAFGTGTEVELTMDDSGDPNISFFNSSLSYHIKVSGSDSDTTKIYQIFAFTDLDEINNSIYRSLDLVTRRIQKEINQHTHVTKEKSLILSTLIDGLEINDVLRINSDFRGGTPTDNIVSEITITGTPRSLLSTVSANEYLDFTKG